MNDGPDIVGIADLIGDHVRADILTALMTDQALTPTELAEIAGVTKQTISAHLAKLLDASLVAVVSQGRHRYFRLADRDVPTYSTPSALRVADEWGGFPLQAGSTGAQQVRNRAKPCVGRKNRGRRAVSRPILLPLMHVAQMAAAPWTSRPS